MHATDQILEIRGHGALAPLDESIRSGLQVPAGAEKTLPTLLLYNEEGLKLFERITFLEEYYLTGQEIKVLEKYADRIADRIASRENTMIVELGSGNLRKVKILLDALDRKGKQVSYYALDLSRPELERTLSAIPEGTFKNVKCFGLLGTYDDGLAWLKQPAQAKKPKTIISLGSSIGNFDASGAADFLAQFMDLLSPEDSFLVGVDGCTDADRVYHAYNDCEDVTHEFILNGLHHANQLLGREEFHVPDWKVIGAYNKQADRHEAFVSPCKDVVVAGVTIRQGEKVRIEESYKYDSAQVRSLWQACHVSEVAKWTNDESNYGLHLINRPMICFASKPASYAAHPVPSIQEWDALWKAWDAVSQDMIPKEELLAKPIKLRNACIFYLGHIPTFLDMHLTRATKGYATEPQHYPSIFERGIDPDVDNPEQCHAHSEIPDSWPPAAEILDFQTRVRMRTKKLYSSGQAYSDPKIARAMWLGFEHEIMHMETLLYMLIQSEKTLAPPGTVQPDFEALAEQSKANAVPNQWFNIPAQDFSVGLDDPDSKSSPDHYYGWDVEKPSRRVQTSAFKAKARPITNGEYGLFLEQTGRTSIPSSWSQTDATNGVTAGTTNGSVTDMNSPSGTFLAGKAVKTVYGLIPLRLALEWPVSASYDELAACAAWMGGRIPTLEEARSVYIYSEEIAKLQAENAQGRKIPAVNGHLVNDGVEETPPSVPSVNGAADAVSTLKPENLHADLTDANVGFKHWHPVSVTQNGDKLSGLSEMGGLWEWTSTALAQHEGYEPMELYPAYSSDFFDAKHNVVLGGSWATHPRIAGRKTFVNWYQRNYPYVWAGARLVKDI